MEENKIAKIVRILTEYDGYCHAIIQMDEQGLETDLVKIPVSKIDFPIEVGTVVKCRVDHPLCLEKIEKENVVRIEEFLEITKEFDQSSYPQLLEMFERLKGKVGFFCPQYPECTLKFLVQILASYPDLTSLPDSLHPTIGKFICSKPVSDCLKEKIKEILDLDEYYEGTDLKDFNSTDFFFLEHHLTRKSEEGKEFSNFLFQLVEYFHFEKEDEKETKEGYEKKLGERKETEAV